MSGNKAGYHKYQNRRRNNPTVGSKAREVLEQIDESNSTIQLFRAYSAELDDKHDRHERIVKLSRDITIESKRIIFLLHNSDTDIDERKVKIFRDAEVRLNTLIQKNFQIIASELQGQDSYLYLRAYTAGLQEFVEAMLFFLYLSRDTVQEWSEINDRFKYEKENEGTIVELLFPEAEFILGIGDFTGELMRKCINSLGSGNVDNCFKICNFVKHIYTGFLGIHNSGYKEIGRKLYVLKQSLMKMELVCYNIKVRGSEVPKHMLATVFTEPSTEEDEGFF